MGYNTRRKSLSLPSLGIQLPATSRAHRRSQAASSSSSSSSTPSDPPPPPPPLSKRLKRAHLSQPLSPDPPEQDDDEEDEEEEETKQKIQQKIQQKPPRPNKKNIQSEDENGICQRTPPASPSISPSLSPSPNPIDTSSINDDIVVAVIHQLERTGNRPHLIKELATALADSNPTIANSANAAALLSSRLSLFLKRPGWTPANPCPIAKELIPVHPRKVFFYLTTCAPQALIDDCDDVVVAMMQKHSINRPDGGVLGAEEARHNGRSAPIPIPGAKANNAKNAAGHDDSQMSPLEKKVEEAIRRTQALGPASWASQPLPPSPTPRRTQSRGGPFAPPVVNNTDSARDRSSSPEFVIDQHILDDLNPHTPPFPGTLSRPIPPHHHPHHPHHPHHHNHHHHHHSTNMQLHCHCNCYCRCNMHAPSTQSRYQRAGTMIGVGIGGNTDSNIHGPAGRIPLPLEASRAMSPPLEGDEEEFTRTATSVRERTAGRGRGRGGGKGHGKGHGNGNGNVPAPHTYDPAATATATAPTQDPHAQIRDSARVMGNNTSTSTSMSAPRPTPTPPSRMILDGTTQHAWPGTSDFAMELDLGDLFAELPGDLDLDRDRNSHLQQGRNREVVMEDTEAADDERRRDTLPAPVPAPAPVPVPATATAPVPVPVPDLDPGTTSASSSATSVVTDDESMSFSMSSVDVSVSVHTPGGGVGMYQHPSLFGKNLPGQQTMKEQTQTQTQTQLQLQHPLQQQQQPQPQPQPQAQFRQSHSQTQTVVPSKRPLEIDGEDTPKARPMGIEGGGGVLGGPPPEPSSSFFDDEFAWNDMRDPASVGVEELEKYFAEMGE